MSKNRIFSKKFREYNKENFIILCSMHNVRNNIFKMNFSKDFRNCLKNNDKFLENLMRKFLKNQRCSPNCKDTDTTEYFSFVVKQT